MARRPALLSAVTLFARAGDGVASLPTFIKFFKDGLSCPVMQLGDDWIRVDTGGTPVVVQVTARYA